jgi:hypothetical protein
MRGVFLAAVLMASAWPMSAWAEDCEAPCAGYTWTGELSNDWIFAADPSELKANLLTPTVTLDLFVQPVEHVKLVSAIITDQVIDPEPGRNSSFKGIGSYVEEAYTEITFDPLTFKAGKFNAEFSLASAEAPGENSTDLAGNLDTDERLGGEAAIAFEAAGWNHRLTGAAFTTDRTALSESLFNNRGRTRLSDGGAGNTEGISSFSAVLDGCAGAEPAECYNEGDYGYRLGLRYQRAGHATEEMIEEELTPHPEWAFLGAAHWKTDIGDNTLRLLGETAYLKHFEGGEDNAWIVTGSAALEVDQITYSAAYSRQRNLVPGGPDTREHLADLSLLYQSEDDQPFAGANWSLGAGYTFAQNEDRERTHTLSATLTLEFGGTTGGEK